MGNFERLLFRSFVRVLYMGKVSTFEYFYCSLKIIFFYFGSAFGILTTNSIFMSPSTCHW
jgi:hypothetical protein